MIASQHHTHDTRQIRNTLHAQPAKSARHNIYQSSIKSALSASENISIGDRLIRWSEHYFHVQFDTLTCSRQKKRRIRISSMISRVLWISAFLFWNLIFIYILEIYTYTYTVFATTTTDENIGRRPTRPHHQLLLILCFRLSGCRETNTKDTKNQNPATHHIVLNTQHDHTLYIEFDHIKLRWFVSV